MHTVANILSEAYARPISVESLIEESPFLKHDRIREWVGYMMLRRAGEFEATDPVPFAGAHVRVMREAFDHDQMNALIAAERRKNPRVDAWFAQRHVSTYTAKDLAACPEGSFGALFYRRVASMGYEVDMAANLPLNTDFDYWIIRGLQFHDPEHLLGGAGFDLVGESMPSTMRQASLLRHFSPELAGALNAPTFLLNMSQLSSCMLYTPEAYPLLFERFQRAWLIGSTSGPYFLGRFEDVFHLPLPEARRVLGMRNVDDLDTKEMSDHMLSRRVA